MVPGHNFYPLITSDLYAPEISNSFSFRFESLVGTEDLAEAVQVEIPYGAAASMLNGRRGVSI